jgi:hypothetical protein
MSKPYYCIYQNLGCKHTGFNKLGKCKTTHEQEICEFRPGFSSQSTITRVHGNAKAGKAKSIPNLKNREMFTKLQFEIHNAPSHTTTSSTSSTMTRKRKNDYIDVDDEQEKEEEEEGAGSSDENESDIEYYTQTPQKKIPKFNPESDFNLSPWHDHTSPPPPQFKISDLPSPTIHNLFVATTPDIPKPIENITATTTTLTFQSSLSEVELLQQQLKQFIMCKEIEVQADQNKIDQSIANANQLFTKLIQCTNQTVETCLSIFL